MGMSDHDSDRAAIIELIHRNRITMWTNDFDGWDNCFVQAPYTTKWSWWQGGGVTARRGWENLSARRRSDHPPVVLDYAYKTTVEDLCVQIGEDMAWATFVTQEPAGVEFPDHVGPGRRYELRVFEKHDGEWKIALVGTLDENGGPADTSMLRLDPAGRVLWASNTAKAALADDEDLVLRAGVLHFRDRRVDRKFRDVLAWAAATLDFGYSAMHGARPLVVEAGEGLPTRIYWIIARSEMIILTLAANRLDPRRLELAAAVYDLSPAQLRLAALIVEGLPLTDIAERMGVTVNTARTHLNRVFDKVGVRTQPALVRVLLTAISPV
jgi:DNA-binding CsgD family transcriptional regulator